MRSGSNAAAFAIIYGELNDPVSHACEGR